MLQPQLLSKIAQKGLAWQIKRLSWPFMQLVPWAYCNTIAA